MAKETENEIIERCIEEVRAKGPQLRAKYFAWVKKKKEVSNK